MHQRFFTKGIGFLSEKIASCSTGITFTAGAIFVTNYSDTATANPMFQAFDQPTGVYLATQNTKILRESSQMRSVIPHRPGDYIPAVWEELKEKSEYDQKKKNEVHVLHKNLTKIEEELDHTLTMSDWKIISSSQGVTIKQSTKENEPAIFLVETIIDAPPIWVLRSIALKNLREEWDNSVKFEDLINIENTLICRRTTSDALAGGIISARDFVDLLGLKKNGETYRFISKEFKDSRFPSEDYVVRGKNYGSGIWLTPTQERFDVDSNNYLGNEPSTVYKALIQVDIRGWIPQSIQDMAMTTLVLDSLPHMRRWLQKKLCEIH